MGNVVAQVPEVSDSCIPDLLDEEVIARAQRGEREAVDRLLQKYRYLVRARARRFASHGVEVDDLTQIGMIGLWHAIMQFRRGQSLSFPAYASLCVRRRLISAFKARCRRKREGDARIVQLEQVPGAEAWTTFMGCGAWTMWQDPADAVLAGEEYLALCRALRSLLSRVEWTVLLEHQRGRSYREIAEDLRCSVKAVDNAISRARRKVQAIAAAPAELRERLMDASCSVTRRASRRRTTARRRVDGFRAAEAPV